MVAHLWAKEIFNATIFPSLFPGRKFVNFRVEIRNESFPFRLGCKLKPLAVSNGTHFGGRSIRFCKFEKIGGNFFLVNVIKQRVFFEFGYKIRFRNAVQD